MNKHYSMESEQSVIGGLMLLDGKSHDDQGEKERLAGIKSEVFGTLEDSDFVDDSLRELFKVIKGMFDANLPVDVLLVGDEILRKKLPKGSELVGQLGDLARSTPSVTNLVSYAKIVKRYALERALRYESGKLAGETDLSSQILTAAKINQISSALSYNAATKKNIRYAKTMREFCSQELPALEYCMDPVVPKRSGVMIYGGTGCGKTYLALNLAHAMAIGHCKIGEWTVGDPQKVLIIDGEMDKALYIERAQTMAQAHNNTFPERLHLLSAFDFDNDGPGGSSMDLTQPYWQQIVENMITDLDLDVVVFDNLGVLFRFDQVGQVSADTVRMWLLHLQNRLGVSTISIHHAVKRPNDDSSANYYGSAVLAQGMSNVFQLQKTSVESSDDDDELRLSFRIKWDKARTVPVAKQKSYQFSMNNETGLWRVASEPTKRANMVALIVECIQGGLDTPGAMAKELEIKAPTMRSTLHRLKKKNPPLVVSVPGCNRYELNTDIDYTEFSDIDDTVITEGDVFINSKYGEDSNNCVILWKLDLWLDKREVAKPDNEAGQSSVDAALQEGLIELNERGICLTSKGVSCLENTKELRNKG